MSIPVATHRLKLYHLATPPGNVDPWEKAPTDDALTLFASGVRAVIGTGGGTTNVGRGGTVNDSESVDYVVSMDPQPALTYLDVVEDEATGRRYAVKWVVTTPGVVGLLANTRAGLTTYAGAGTAT